MVGVLVDIHGLRETNTFSLSGQWTINGITFEPWDVITVFMDMDFGVEEPYVEASAAIPWPLDVEPVAGLELALALDVSSPADGSLSYSGTVSMQYWDDTQP